MIKLLHLSLFFIFAFLSNCHETGDQQITASRGKVRSPITVEATALPLQKNEFAVSITIKLWENCSFATFTLRASPDYDLISGNRTTVLNSCQDGIVLHFTVKTRTREAAAIALDAEITTAEQNYRSSHEILLLRRREHTPPDGLKTGQRKIRELR